MRRTEAEARETRKTIVDAAQQVFFENGVCRSSLEQIARSAGVTRGAVYWHFRNKTHLFEEIHREARTPMEDVLERLLQADAADGGPAKLEAFCVESLLQLHDDEKVRRLFTTILLKCEATGEMQPLWDHLRRTNEETVARLEAIFARFRKEGSIPTRSEPRVLAQALHAYMTGLFIDYLRSPACFRMPEDASTLVRHFFASITPAAAETGSEN